MLEGAAAAGEPEAMLGAGLCRLLGEGLPRDDKVVEKEGGREGGREGQRDGRTDGRTEGER